MYRITIKSSIFLLAGAWVSLGAIKLPEQAASADALAQEAEVKVNKAIEATQEKSPPPAVQQKPQEKETAPAARNVATTTPAEKPPENLSPLLYNDGKMNYATSATKFQLTAADNLSNVDFIEYRIDDSPFMRYKEPFSIEQEGQRRIVFRAVDRAGNREADNSFVVTIDNTPPQVNATLNGPFYVKDGITYVSTSTKVDLFATDKYSGVKKIEYALNDGNFVEGNSVVLENPGRQTIRYRAIDNLNNVSPEHLVANIQLTVDKEPPVVLIKTSRRPVEHEGKKYLLRDTIYTVEAMDDGAGVDKVLYRLDGEGEFQLYNAPIQFSTEGPHSIEAKAVDRVGNESQIVRLDIITDDEPPTSALKVVEP
ncbi:MAG: hypothetical protein RML34_05890 [Leptospiraceae bacterium]|nr:hypothetical protein [Leptospiraceae bacterium]